MRPLSVFFWGVQAAAVVGVVWLGFSWTGLALALGLYVVRMFGLTAGYHRYLSHRSFKTSRAGQFALAFLGSLAMQKGPLWWAAHHRAHHKYSDTPRDIHSVRQNGFWWAHVKWIMVGRFEPTDWERVKELAVFPELRWLNTYHMVPPIALAAVLVLIGGWPLFVWGFCLSTVLLWHDTFTINSLSHLFGSRRYQTTDTSKNNWVLAILTLGEGWHNNHHHYQGSCRQGFYWWEIDLTYYVLRALAAVGLVWNLHEPPERVLADGRARDAAQKAA